VRSLARGAAHIGRGGPGAALCRVSRFDFARDRHHPARDPEGTGPGQRRWRCEARALWRGDARGDRRRGVIVQARDSGVDYQTLKLLKTMGIEMIRNMLLATAALAVATSAQAAAPAPKKSSTATASATLPASNPFAQPSSLTLQAP